MKKHDFKTILVPSATVFISSFCIMMLELVASRMVARHLGSSLYTWTAVIGVVLSSITIGYYLGGRIADRFQAQKALSVIFLICSVSCVITIILNNLVLDWLFLWHFSWPMRVFSHVAIVFLLPSLLLGAVSPVVAKMALDKSKAKGRVVGDIYAWGAAGSIAGTFAAGYFLISALGPVAIIWIIGSALLIMSILYWIKFWCVYLWAIAFSVLFVMGMGSDEWVQKNGAMLALRTETNPNIIYEDDTPYCHISVRRLSVEPEVRGFYQDKLKHSEIVMGDINDLRYFHTVVFAAISHHLSSAKEDISVMHIGGGGYVFPQHIEKHWPRSRNDVVEIDAGVTEAAMQAFGLSRDTTINTITMDARNYIDTLLEQEQTGGKATRYDFIYEDAFSDYSLPYQLVTKEFNDKIAHVMSDDGVYMINVVDIFESGRFLGSMIETLKLTFPNIYVLTEKGTRPIRGIFVVVASKKKLDIDSIFSTHKKRDDIWCLNDEDMAFLKERSRGIILTDDYAPVENLLAPVVLKSAKEILAREYMQRAETAKKQQSYSKSISQYRKAIKINPMTSIKAYNEIALMQAQTGKLEEAVESFREAIHYKESRKNESDIASIYYNLGVALQRLGRKQEAHKHFLTAIEGFKEEVNENPDSHLSWTRLGDTYAIIGDFKEAVRAFSRALSLSPTNTQYYSNLAKALKYNGQFTQAIQLLKKGINFFMENGRTNDAASLKNLLELLQYQETQSK